MATMWVKNKQTGLVWQVSEEHGKRLLASGEYEATEKPQKGRKKQEKKQEAKEAEA